LTPQPPFDVNGKSKRSRFVRLKDLAAQMDLHPRTVKDWWRRLKVPPTIRGQACHRWSPKDADKLLKRWRSYWRKKRYGHPSL
jgi:hypothetical protein